MNRDLIDIMKMNETLETLGEKEDYIDELVNNYEDMKNSRVSNFTLMSKTSDSIPAIIDGVFRRILMTEKEEKVIVTSGLNTISNGSLIELFNKDKQKEYYLVSGRIIDKSDYVEAQVKLCNQTVNMKGWDNHIPCVFDLGNGIMGTDGVQIKDYTATAKIYVQKNTFTEKIDLNTRFIFNSSKMDIFKVTDIDSAENKGLYMVSLEKSKYQNEDDLINNIAFNGVFDEDNNDETDLIPMISGSDKIKIGGQETYTINSKNVVFSLSDNSSASILSQDGSSCVVKSISTTYKKNSIIAEKDNVVIAKKNIIISV